VIFKGRVNISLKVDCKYFGEIIIPFGDIASDYLIHYTLFSYCDGGVSCFSFI
jgi:hypothetical protein